MRPRICRKRVGVKWLSASLQADEPPAGLEQPLLQARQRPALDGERQDQPLQEIAEVAGDDPEEKVLDARREADGIRNTPSLERFIRCPVFDALCKVPSCNKVRAIVRIDGDACRYGVRTSSRTSPR